MRHCSMFLHQQVAHFELTWPFRRADKVEFFFQFCWGVRIHMLCARALCSDTVKTFDLSQQSAEDNVAATNLWLLSVRSFFRLHSDHDKMMVLVSAFRMEAFNCIFSWTNWPTQHSLLQFLCRRSWKYMVWIYIIECVWELIQSILVICVLKFFVVRFLWERMIHEPVIIQLKFVNISLQNGWLDNVHILLYMIIFFVAIHLFRILYNFIYRSFC